MRLGDLTMMRGLCSERQLKRSEVVFKLPKGFKSLKARQWVGWVIASLGVAWMMAWPLLMFSGLSPWTKADYINAWASHPAGEGLSLSEVTAGDQLLWCSAFLASGGVAILVGVLLVFGWPRRRRFRPAAWPK